MRLVDYALLIVNLANKHPEATVIYSIDEEGNSFEPVQYGPSAGKYDKKNREFTHDDSNSKANAVCIN